MSHNLDLIANRVDLRYGLVRDVAWLVCIPGDDTISRESHAIVSVNPKNQQFKIHPGESHGLVHLNGEEANQPQPIKAGDKVELGQTTLMFAPLCPTFSWD